MPLVLPVFILDRMFRFVSACLSDAATPPILTGILIALFLLGIAALSGWLWWRCRQRNRFSYRFGILWDEHRHPFCPVCRTRLGNWSRHSSWKFECREGRTLRRPTTYHAFKCSVCTKPVRLVDHDGYEVSLEQALAQLRAPAGEN